ncbi:MAG: phosphate ABC transporter permease subunit PstC [Pseudomonadota bacterium]
MSVSSILLVLVVLTAFGYILGRRRAVSRVDGNHASLHSRPGYYGSYLALWCALPALLALIVWEVAAPNLIISTVIDQLPVEEQNLSDDQISLLLTDIRNLASGSFTATDPDPVVVAAAKRLNELRAQSDWMVAILVISIAGLGIVYGVRKIAPELRARNAVEQVLKIFLIVCSTIAIVTTVGIVLSLLFESLLFFSEVPIIDFLTGLTWSPQTALRADQVGSSGAFGAVPLFAGTLLISFIAMVVAVPVGLMSAVYLSDYASVRVRGVIKPLLEILAGIPTVVYGFFAAITVGPIVREVGTAMGFNVVGESALAAGMVMGVMIIPFVSSLSDDVINAVPDSLRQGAYGLGATKSECIKQIVLPAALPGIFAAVLLAISRAIGETMIVVMAAGFGANLTANPFEAVTTVTVQIVGVLVGDQEFDSAKTRSAFALGLVLFVATLCMNIAALRVVRKYREKYD